MTNRLAGKLALVTGGSDGIGLAIAAAYAAEGASLILVARDETKLERASRHVSEFGAEVQIYAADLAQASMRDDLVRKLSVANCGRLIDVLVNNAGVSIFTPFGNITEREFDAQVNLNVAAPLFLTQSLLPMMRASGGSVINISSYFADKLLWNRPSSVYSLTKGALNSLTRAMAFELAPSGIRVNAIAPGTVDTALRRNTIQNLLAKQRAEIAESISRLYPSGRIGKVDDLTGIAVYLASDESAWTTGAIMKVDGGLSLT
ncbi:SDR family oxidoreductase (plasmid) [Cupriavidus sp. P-10]|uniref:SDR family NAD(P)-dependent oxidoreductase n=1 Tax=Cupriavidus sp. P-10 TaxID=2027911 RepID=UPI000E2E987F|nr:SDR family oxidoreductase [Cupriavidus sp. P-10]BDB29414.1 SDR family oxidoreductase [Cupriavidus sp. P-10]